MGQVPGRPEDDERAGLGESRLAIPSRRGLTVGEDMESEGRNLKLET